MKFKRCHIDGVDYGDDYHVFIIFLINIFKN
jgi:hypothetical protein